MGKSLKEKTVIGALITVLVGLLLLNSCIQQPNIVLELRPEFINYTFDGEFNPADFFDPTLWKPIDEYFVPTGHTVYVLKNLDDNSLVETVKVAIFSDDLDGYRFIKDNIWYYFVWIPSRRHFHQLSPVMVYEPPVTQYKGV